MTRAVGGRWDVPRWVSPDQLAKTGEMVLTVQCGDDVYRFGTDSLRALQKGDRIVTTKHGRQRPRNSEFAGE